MRRLIEELLDMTFKKAAKPIDPIHTFSANEISEAIRFMKKGEHMGKIVVKMPEDPRSIVSAKATETSLLSDEATYLVVGGLGGLGKSVTRWMVERGARKFCFLSRSAGQSDKDKAFLAELESQACTAVAVPGSVADMDDVKKAIDLSPSPIAGILQMSMVIKVSLDLSNQAVERKTDQLLRIALHSKPATKTGDSFMTARSRGHGTYTTPSWTRI
jgi:D-arabinose 1-dehydrogenase-like Zn-dependent alcohol dehydrogenase